MLAETTWYRKEFESQLRRLLRDAPELLAGLNFQEAKRITADYVVDRQRSSMIGSTVVDEMFSGIGFLQNLS